MRIGLVDVDGRGFPNLALMKLSAWHKAHGDTAEMADPAKSYDRVYMSKVFTHSPDCRDEYSCEVVRGGTGYRDYTTVLPQEVEHTCPDYSLYGAEEAYGFLTRGCPNRCPWCVVSHKEGGIRPHADIEEFLDGHRRELKALICVPCAQPYRDFTSNTKPSREAWRLAYWCNNKRLFNAMDFADYTCK